MVCLFSELTVNLSLNCETSSILKLNNKSFPVLESYVFQIYKLFTKDKIRIGCY